RARELAQTMVGIGHSYNVETVALLTAMDQPLGCEVGNANEIAESIALLRGEGPADLLEVTMALGVEMLSVAGIEADPQEATRLLQKTIDDGSALEVFGRVVESQGGDRRVVDDPAAILPQAPHQSSLKAEMGGFVATLDAFRVGVAAMRLGAGRERKEDTIDPSVGIRIHRKVGDPVEEGERLLTLSYRHPARLDEALSVLEGAITIAPEATEVPSLLIERVVS
ncbi:MAG TPA: hypothetical protein VHL55_01300, partial [Acidimicrobiia bacterium]|nr:hypothetical protein [Acidimicrobiia bacterium]